MQIRTDRGWMRAGLAVLVAGVLGGGVLAAACGTDSPHKLTAEGVATRAAAGKPLDLAAGPGADAPSPGGGDAAKGDPKLGDKVLMGSDGGSVTVSGVEDNVSAGRLFGAGKGFKYVAAEVKGCSGPHEKGLTFEPAYFLLRLDDGTMRDHGPGAKKPEMAGGTVPAGGCLSGWVTFTVPDGALPTGVVYDGSTRTTWTVPLPKDAKPTTTTTMKPGTSKEPAESPSSSSSTTSTTGRARPASTTTTSTTRAASSAKATTSTTTAKSSGSTSTTGTTGKSTGSTTSTTGKSSGSTTSTTGKSSASTTTTTAKE